MLSRREVVGKLATGAAGAAVVFAATAGGANALSAREDAATGPVEGAWAPGPNVIDAGPPSTLTAEAPWELIHPLALGSVVAPGWAVAGLGGAVDGSCVLTLQNERGRSYRVHVCRNDGRPQGLVHTDRFDLVVMNGGQGDLPTEEGLAQAVAEVAHVLAANEGQAQQLVKQLLPHGERLSMFAGEIERKLR